MGKAVKIFLLLCVLLAMPAAGPITAGAEGGDLAGFIPDTITESGITPIYDKYKWSNYVFDIEEKTGWLPSVSRSAENVTGSVFTFVISAIFLILVLLSKITTFILISAYKMNVFNIIPEGINAIVLAVKNGIYDGLYEVLVCVVGIYGMYKSYKGDKTSGFKVSLVSIVILGLSVVFFQNPSLFGQGLNRATEVICTKVLYEVSKPAGIDNGETVSSEDDAVVLMGNHFWNIAVMKPYELIQYGEIGRYDPDEFLRRDAGSEERRELAGGYAERNSSFSFGGIPARLGLVVVMLIVGLVYCICILIISGFLVYYQSAALFWICFAGVFFLMSLYPGNGLKILARWFFETFGFFLQKIVLTTALSIYFAIAAAIYAMTGRYGLLGVVILNISLLVVAILKHKRIYELIFGLLLNDPGMVNSGMQKESFASRLSKFAVTAYTGQKLYSGAREMLDKRKRASFDKKYKSKASDVLSQRYVMEKSKARKEAEGRLHDKYRKEKEGAEARAADRNRKPEYSRFVQQAEKRGAQGMPLFTEEQIQEETKVSDFVSQADARKQKGYTPFSEDQVNSTLSSMYKLKKEGNDPDRLTFVNVEGKSDNEIRAGQQERNAENRFVGKSLERDRKANDKSIKRNIEGRRGQDAKMGVVISRLTQRAAVKTAKVMTDPKEAALTGMRAADKIIETKEAVRKAPGAVAEYVKKKVPESVEKIRSLTEKVVKAPVTAVKNIDITAGSMRQKLLMSAGKPGAETAATYKIKKLPGRIYKEKGPDTHAGAERLHLGKYGEVEVIGGDGSLVTLRNHLGNEFRIGRKAFEEERAKGASDTEEITQKEEKKVTVNRETKVTRINKHIQKQEIKDISEVNLKEEKRETRNTEMSCDVTENIQRTGTQMKSFKAEKKTEAATGLTDTAAAAVPSKKGGAAEMLFIANTLNNMGKSKPTRSSKIERMLEDDEDRGE